MSSNIGLEPFQVHLACAYMQHSTFTFTFFCTSDHCMHPRSTCNIYFYLFFFTLDIWPVHAATCNSNFPNNLTQCPVQCSALSSSPTHQFHCFLCMKIPCTSYLYSSYSGALIRNDCHTLIALLSASQITAPALTVFCQGCNALATVHSCIISQILGYRGNICCNTS